MNEFKRFEDRLPPLENLTLRQRITDKYLANLVTSVNSN